MTNFEWRSEYETGVDSIDAQHRELMRMLAELSADLAAMRDPAAFDSVLGELDRHFAAHFPLEDKLMRDAGFVAPLAEYHRREHKNFLIRLAEIKRRRQNGEDYIAAELLAFLMNWFNDHVRNLDVATIAALAEQKAAQDRCGAPRTK